MIDIRFNDGFLLADGKVIAEITTPADKAEDFFNYKTGAGIARIINGKNELQVKYDRLLKDYELARHECKQKDEHIVKLEQEQEELLKKNSALCEKIEDYRERISIQYETIQSIRKSIDRWE